ncbi:hypothetical protein BBW65_00725 [Helicobacter enhydrae]|uniref:Uncharacterized protein n=1 Tax=Helicobacter enhydrae TaxID=222136 RepID=A0A1B1U3S6_9HELI|nr:hypothetical protein BBW65_00725 [Helicobacter enhydrae]
MVCSKQDSKRKLQEILESLKSIVSTNQLQKKVSSQAQEIQRYLFKLNQKSVKIKHHNICKTFKGIL